MGTQILSDTCMRSVRGVPYPGPIWRERTLITRTAEVYVFLYHPVMRTATRPNNTRTSVESKATAAPKRGGKARRKGLAKNQADKDSIQPRQVSLPRDMPYILDWAGACGPHQKFMDAGCL